MLQSLAGQARMPPPPIIIFSFDHPEHDLSTRPQAPAALATVLRVLQCKVDAERKAALLNVLVDHRGVERIALVPVCPACPCL